MRLLFVADGQRDRAAVPPIVARIVDGRFDVDFREWKRLRLNRGSGYRRKLQFALVMARDEAIDGVVATLDSDNAPRRERLLQLHAARENDRRNPQATPLPTALGEAAPHLEAWLLDDPTAVRQVLRLPPDHRIDSVHKADPKVSLDGLMSESERADSPIAILEKFAAAVVTDRCNHSSDTGFNEFMQDVKTELEPAFKSSF